MKTFSAVIADDHPLLLVGLKDYLTRHEFNIIGMKANGLEALTDILNKNPDYAILDYDMPGMNGLNIAEACLKEGSSTKFVLLSSYNNPLLVEHAKEIGIDGYILKEQSLDKILDCLTNIQAGKKYYDRNIGTYSASETRKLMSQIKSLSKSELKVLKLIADHQSTIEIAETLFISARTVEKHRSNISIKLGLKGKAHQLISWTSKHADFLFISE